MSIIFVKDDILSLQDIELVVEMFSNSKQQRRPEWFEKFNLPLFLAPLIEETGKIFDLSSCVGYELWTHFNSRPEPHFDKDEHLAKTTGEIAFPLCSIVYYPYLKDLQDGCFRTTDMLVKPSVNRMICFSPGLGHEVDPYTGDRFCLAINPWGYRVNVDY